MKTNTSLLKRLSMTILWVLLSSLVLAAQDQTVTPKMSNEIVERIRAKTIERNKKYSGIESVEDTLAQTFDSETGELQESTRVVLVRRYYYYENAEVTALKYEKDGEELPVSEYKPPGKGEPGYHVFDEKGAEHYDVKVVGTKTIGSRKCYHLKISSKENTVKHVVGDMYFETKDLELVHSKLSLGKLPFGVKKMEIVSHYKSENGVTAPASNSIEIFAHVPFVYPNKKIVINSKISKQKYIPRSK
ncbi:MAG: hypothetical protein GY866_31740 [Proteobacteria bacterium]|nr:hypothetical protein [Pseudomonadota bacterium]